MMRNYIVTLLVVSITPAFAMHNLMAEIPPPKQPSRQGNLGAYEIIGQSFVSGQQMFLGTPDKVYFIDKTENNPTQIKGHPAWASEYSLGSNTQRAMDVITNSFCAGGNVLGNGTWVNVGGNQAVKYGGDPADRQDGGGPYNDPDGRKSIRLLTPCDNLDCDWSLSPQQSTLRWYPTVETLEDGTLIILGGCTDGGYVNNKEQNNPTYEFFPTRGPPVLSPVLENTLPTNLFPLTWLLPSGRLLVQSNYATVLLDYKTATEVSLDDIPDAVRTYPASAGTVMLPLTPANNWTATILFCGGSAVETQRWTDPNFVVIQQPASTSCVKITPDQSPSYIHDDPLLERRSMANFILLPTGKVFCLNGARTGTAGYGNNSWAVGQSYADDPVLTPATYDPNAPAGARWSNAGFSPSTVPRMYHSSATLVPDGSVLVSGSNPNSDYADNVKYSTEYRTELFYPEYYNERRPEPKGFISHIGYGGPSFNLTLTSEDLFGDIDNLNKTTVVIIRTGFCTHSMNMGQRFVQLESTFTGYQTGTGNTTFKGILHVSQLPPNPSILVPGPALVFVVINGIPSVGQQIMVGSGELGEQEVKPAGMCPESRIIQTAQFPSDDTIADIPETQTKRKGGGTKVDVVSSGDFMAAWMVLLAAFIFGV